MNRSETIKEKASTALAMREVKVGDSTLTVPVIDVSSEAPVDWGAFGEHAILRMPTEHGKVEINCDLIQKLNKAKPDENGRVPQITIAEMVVNLQKCLAQGLNPITDVVWVKYSAGKPCMMHILDACLMRRADEHPEYEGYTCGWILGGAGDKVGRKCIPAGSDIPPGMQIIGAWCQAHRKGRKTSPVEALIKDYRKPGEAWGAMSETMIAKVARAQAHRIAFPGPLAGLYSEVEGAQDEGLEVVSEAKELSSRGAEALSGELTTAMFGNDLAPEAEDSEVPPPVEGSAAGPSTPAATPTERGSDTLW